MLPVSRFAIAFCVASIPMSSLATAAEPPKTNGIASIGDLTLDFESFRDAGFLLGHGSILGIPESFPMIRYLEHLMEFCAVESCGKCFPCRIGTQRLTERLNGEANDLSPEAWTAEVNDIGEAMKATSACGLGMAAPNVTESLLKYFPEQVTAASNRQANP